MSTNRSVPQRPVWTLAFAVTTISTGAWTQILAAMVSAASAIEIFNSTGSILKLSTGTPGNEIAGLFPMTILPGGSNLLISTESNSNVKTPGSVSLNAFRKGLPLTVECVDVAATGGYIVINAFG